MKRPDLRLPSRPLAVFDVVEATQVGSVYVVQAATDIDSPAYGVQKYELDSESGKFGLQISTKLDGSQEVKAILTIVID